MNFKKDSASKVQQKPFNVKVLHRGGSRQDSRGKSKHMSNSDILQNPDPPKANQGGSKDELI
jgi:hypothetical protein